jgi:hypothetical protein
MRTVALVGIGLLALAACGGEVAPGSELAEQTTQALDLDRVSPKLSLPTIGVAPDVLRPSVNLYLWSNRDQRLLRKDPPQTCG